MLLRFFRQTLPQVVAAIVAIAIAIWIKTFMAETAMPFYFDSIQMPLYRIFNFYIPRVNLYSKLFVFVIGLFISLYLLQVNSKHIVIKQRTYLPTLMYILVVFGFIPLQRVNPAIIAAFFMVFTIDQLFSTYHKPDALNNLFKATFFLGIASLFYAPSVFFMAAVFMSLLIVRTFNPREWMVAIAGFATPWLFYVLYHYLVNYNLNIAFEELRFNLLTDVSGITGGYLFYVFYSAIALIYLVTLAFLLRSLPSQKINVRKYYGILFWFLLVSVMLYAFLPSCSIEIAYIVAIPLAFQFSHFFALASGKFWSNLLFAVLLGIVGLMQFFKL